MDRTPAVAIFAVESDAIQITWSGWAADEITVEAGAKRVTVGCDPPAWLRRRGRRAAPLNHLAFGPGALRIDGLAPGTTYEVYVSGPGVARCLVDSITTPTPPPGRLLGRFATISDLHVGERGFGARGTIEDAVPLPSGLRPYPLRCAQAAIEEAVAWGAKMIVVKGDLTANSEPLEFAEVGRLLAAAEVPSAVVLGNHDVRNQVDGTAVLARFGVHASFQPEAFDFDGLRVVLGHSPHARNRSGHVASAQREAMAALASDVGTSTRPRPAVVVLHHPPQRWPWPMYYPPGIVQPDATALLRRLRRANPRIVLLAGHSHRNRRYRMGGVTVAEVGSTKDYPGQWAGYSVYEGGITQVVQRIAAPEVLAWTESTRRALGGVWGWWSAGDLQDRCWSETWPRSASA